MLKAGLLGIIVAVVAVAATYLVGDVISGPFLSTPPGGDVAEEIPIGVAIFSTVFVSAIGVGIAALVKRFASNPVKIFLGICVVGLAVMTIFPFISGENVATGIWLNIMHIAAAIPVVGLVVKEMQTSAVA